MPILFELALGDVAVALDFVFGHGLVSSGTLKLQEPSGRASIDRL